MLISAAAPFTLIHHAHACWVTLQQLEAQREEEEVSSAASTSALVQLTTRFFVHCHELSLQGVTGMFACRGAVVEHRRTLPLMKQSPAGIQSPQQGTKVQGEQCIAKAG